jgi:hypothetical protein
VSDNKTAMVMREADASALAMVMQPSEAVERLRELQSFVRDVMVEGEDFGVLPGTKPDRDGNPPKKILMQPGAQKLAEIYGLAITYGNERAPIERWDDADPLFAYFKTATITRRRDGLFLGSGVGSCNSREKKYASRWVFERDVPPHLDLARLPRKEGIGKNGRPFVQYRVPNPEIFDLVNTIEKMACKRALVHAVIAVTRSSGLFTQDLDDMGSNGGERERGRGEVHDGEFVDDAPPSPPTVAHPRPPSASDLMHRLDGAGRDAARAVLADCPKGMPKVRGHAWRKLIEMAGDVDEVGKLRDEILADAMPDGITNTLLDECGAAARRLAIEDPGDTAGAAT